MDKIVVTGVSSFIGSNLASFFQDLNIKYWAQDQSRNLNTVV